MPCISLRQNKLEAICSCPCLFVPLDKYSKIPLQFFFCNWYSKYFNGYAQEIGQFCSFLFNFSWSKKLLISTSQGNDPLAPDFHINDTTRIKTLFNLNSN